MYKNPRHAQKLGRKEFFDPKTDIVASTIDFVPLN